MTWTPTSSPTRRAAAAPASVAALTDPTSPRTMAVTKPASTFCQPTKTTFAVLTIASAASIMPIKPRVSTSPSASPISALGVSAIPSPAGSLRDFPSSCDRYRVHDAFDLDELHDIDQVRHDARMVRQHADASARFEAGPAGHPNGCVFFR